MAEFDVKPSPGAWKPPPGVRPAWNWTPPGHGLRQRRDRVPVWVRVWSRIPFADRFAYAWMWRHGGWDIVPFVDQGPEASGLSAPTVPKPVPPTIGLARMSAENHQQRPGPDGVR